MFVDIYIILKQANNISMLILRVWPADKLCQFSVLLASPS